ncbi:RHS repeat domain-containing protein [Nitrosomonas sp.]|uniref:RHS repeat domain-containing protein n=1 Tax=Nitrosomonas sp. TaxID=42353 RepID=UPI00343D8B28
MMNWFRLRPYIRIICDGSSRIQTMTDSAGGIYQYAYDVAGNLISALSGTVIDMQVYAAK